MPRSQSPVLLPGDPTAALHAASKQYVDAGDSGKLDVALRGAVSGVGSLDSSGKQPVGELAVHTHSYVPTSSVGAASGVAALDAYTRLTVAQMPRVLSVVRTATVNSSFTPNVDITISGQYFDITVTGDIVVGAPTNPVNHQAVKFVFYASGATRNIQFSSSITIPGNLSNNYTIPSGQLLFAAIQYSSFVSAWVLLAAATNF